MSELPYWVEPQREKVQNANKHLAEYAADLARRTIDDRIEEETRQTWGGEEEVVDVEFPDPERVAQLVATALGVEVGRVEVGGRPVASPEMRAAGEYEMESVYRPTIDCGDYLVIVGCRPGSVEIREADQAGDER